MGNLAVADQLNNIYATYLLKINQTYIPEWLTIQFLANNLVSFIPLVSYGTVVWSIRRCKTSLGFSIDICATMLLASILRISYYLITPYELSLLKQSSSMIFIQLILLATCLKYRPEQYKYDYLSSVESLNELLHNAWMNSFFIEYTDDLTWNTIRRKLSARKIFNFCYRVALIFLYKFLKFFDPSYKRFKSFWQWNDDRQYWKFLFWFTTLQLLITIFIAKILKWAWLSEFIGLLIGSSGLLIESLLPLPQISILHKLESVRGFKIILLITWLCGDILKITYLIFGAKNIAMVFLFFAYFQMSLDIYIALQYIYYKYYYKPLKEESIELREMPINTSFAESNYPNIKY